MSNHRATGDGADSVYDVEHISGGAGSDTLTGDAGPNVIDGLGGFDACDGGGGLDSLIRCP